jgi:hypothetical protein
MAKSHFITPRVPQAPAHTVRLGTTVAPFNTDDTGKLVKLSAESAYELCAVGDPIEAVVAAVETGKSGGFIAGSIYDQGAIFALADGLQATPGVGALAVGDYVVAGTITAKNTKLASFPKVCKATQQPGVTEAAVIGDVNDQIKVALFPWRVVSLGSAGTGAVGTAIVIERV